MSTPPDLARRAFVTAEIRLTAAEALGFCPGSGRMNERTNLVRCAFVAAERRVGTAAAHAVSGAGA